MIFGIFDSLPLEPPSLLIERADVINNHRGDQQQQDDGDC